MVGEATAQTREPTRPIKHALADWNRTIEQARNFVANPSEGAVLAEGHLDALNTLRTEADQIRASAEERVQSLESQLAALGPPPEGEAATEPAEIA